MDIISFIALSGWSSITLVTLILLLIKIRHVVKDKNDEGLDALLIMWGVAVMLLAFAT